MSAFTLLKALAIGAKLYTLKGETDKCIRMGITVFKIVIRRHKKWVLWSRIAFYGTICASSKNKISDYKTNDLPPQMTMLSQLSPK